MHLHFMFPLFPENRKYIPYFLGGKNLFRNVAFQILNSTPVS